MCRPSSIVLESVKGSALAVHPVTLNMVPMNDATIAAHRMIGESLGRPVSPAEHAHW